MKLVFKPKSPIFESVNTPKIIDEIEEIAKNVDSSINKDIKIPKDVLNSFQIKNELNPDIWIKNKLNPKIKPKLIKIATDFLKDLKLPKGIEIKDIIFTGSLANFNWSKFSDIDLHIVLDFKEFDSDPKIIEEFFWAQKALWNKEHDVEIFNYPIEIYVQDINAKLVATAVYSVMKDKWIRMPHPESFQLDKNAIKNKANKIINILKDIRQAYNDGDYKSVVTTITKLKDKITNMRDAGLEAGGEFSLENLVFKTLRRTDFMDILDSFKAKAYDKLMSVSEVSTTPPNDMIDEGEILNNTKFKYLRVDEDEIRINAIYDHEIIGSLLLELMLDAYWHFDEIPEDEFYKIFPDGKLVIISSVEIKNNKYKGQGIAKELMKRAIAKAKQQGFNSIALNASPMGSQGLPLNDLVEFYKSFGFKELLHQGNNVLMYMTTSSEIDEVKQLPYDPKPEIRQHSYSSLSNPTNNIDLSQIKFKMAKAAHTAIDFRNEYPDDHYFSSPTDGDGFYQVEITHDGQVRTKHVRASGDMEQRSGPFKPSDLGTCRDFQNIAKYCFVAAGKNRKSIGASPAEDAANKALIIFKDEILSFLNDAGHNDGKGAQISKEKMSDKQALHKQKKDLETQLHRRLTDSEWDYYLDTGVVPKTRHTITVDPDKAAAMEKRQAELQAKIDALKAKRNSR